MKIALACDHGGLNLKREIIKYLTENGYEYKDFGTNSFDSCDYPDYALPAAEAVAGGECDFGIVICSTGIGVSIVANKVKGIRCAHCHDTYCAEFTRLHNNANMLAMGEKVVGPGLAIKIVEKFLTTQFEGGRHERRVNKITEIENKYCK
ncbi:MAG: ribose 5-phosphate isomerase B [Clostridia bacterium]|nr:ribose 5-phosphate isomerase B [Clostridia bacterium]